MEGVVVLATETVMLGLSLWEAILLASIFAFVFGVILWCVATDDVQDFLNNTVWSILAGILMFLYLFAFAVNTTEETHYKVTIDETVNFVEFNEKYEIIDQEGEIYTIRERTE